MLYEMSQIQKDEQFRADRKWSDGCQRQGEGDELLFSGHRVSVFQDEKFGGWWRWCTHVNVLIPLSYALKVTVTNTHLTVTGDSGDMEADSQAPSLRCRCFTSFILTTSLLQKGTSGSDGLGLAQGHPVTQHKVTHQPWELVSNCASRAMSSPRPL